VWAASLGERGFVYLDEDRLQRLQPDGRVSLIASGVSEAAVAPNLGRIAFAVQSTENAFEIRGYDVTLQAQYRILREALPISRLSWSPDARRLAYLLGVPENGSAALKVKSLTGSGGLTTVTSGYLEGASWLADSNSLVFSAWVDVKGALVRRVFRINGAPTPARLTGSAALSAPGAMDAWDPRPSVDGHQLAFLAGSAEIAQVWLMNADGTGLTRLTSFDAEVFPYSCRDLHWGES
jgi:Tol biopolymer transport system component